MKASGGKYERTGRAFDERTDIKNGIRRQNSMMKRYGKKYDMSYDVANRSYRLTNKPSSKEIDPKKAATVALGVLGTAAVAGAAIYMRNNKLDKAFMNDLNDRINTGKTITNVILERKLNVGDYGGDNPVGSSKVSYWGNDNKLHEARVDYKYDSNGRVTESRYTNYDADKQQPVTLKEAKKLRRGKK